HGQKRTPTRTFVS
ncbi:NMT1-like family protein, partial [Vibrio parahaemolyticus EKP-028]